MEIGNRRLNFEENLSKQNVGNEKRVLVIILITKLQTGVHVQMHLEVIPASPID